MLNKIAKISYYIGLSKHEKFVRMKLPPPHPHPNVCTVKLLHSPVGCDDPFTVT